MRRIDWQLNICFVQPNSVTSWFYCLYFFRNCRQATELTPIYDHLLLLLLDTIRQPSQITFPLQTRFTRSGCFVFARIKISTLLAEKLLVFLFFKNAKRVWYCGVKKNEGGIDNKTSRNGVHPRIKRVDVTTCSWSNQKGSDVKLWLSNFPPINQIQLASRTQLQCAPRGNSIAKLAKSILLVWY